MVASSQLMSLPLCQILSVFRIAMRTPSRVTQHYIRGVRGCDVGSFRIAGHGHAFNHWRANSDLAKGLGSLDQLHLSVTRAVQNHQFALRVAKHKDVAIFEVGFLDRLFE